MFHEEQQQEDQLQFSIQQQQQNYELLLRQFQQFSPGQISNDPDDNHRNLTWHISFDGQAVPIVVASAITFVYMRKQLGEKIRMVQNQIESTSQGGNYDNIFSKDKQKLEKQRRSQTWMVQFLDWFQLFREKIKGYFVNNIQSQMIQDSQKIQKIINFITKQTSIKTKSHIIDFISLPQKEDLKRILYNVLRFIIKQNQLESPLILYLSYNSCHYLLKGIQNKSNQIIFKNFEDPSATERMKFEDFYSLLAPCYKDLQLEEESLIINRQNLLSPLALTILYKQNERSKDFEQIIDLYTLSILKANDKWATINFPQYQNMNIKISFIRSHFKNLQQIFNIHSFSQFNYFCFYIKRRYINSSQLSKIYSHYNNNDAAGPFIIVFARIFQEYSHSIRQLTDIFQKNIGTNKKSLLEIFHLMFEFHFETCYNRIACNPYKISIFISALIWDQLQVGEIYCFLDYLPEYSDFKKLAIDLITKHKFIEEVANSNRPIFMVSSPESQAVSFPNLHIIGQKQQQFVQSYKKQASVVSIGTLQYFVAGNYNRSKYVQYLYNYLTSKAKNHKYYFQKNLFHYTTTVYYPQRYAIEFEKIFSQLQAQLKRIDQSFHINSYSLKQQITEPVKQLISAQRKSKVQYEDTAARPNRIDSKLHVIFKHQSHSEQIKKIIYKVIEQSAGFSSNYSIFLSILSYCNEHSNMIFQQFCLVSYCLLTTKRIEYIHQFFRIKDQIDRQVTILKKRFLTLNSQFQIMITKPEKDANWTHSLAEIINHYWTAVLTLASQPKMSIYKMLKDISDNLKFGLKFVSIIGSRHMKTRMLKQIIQQFFALCTNSEINLNDVMIFLQYKTKSLAVIWTRDNQILIKYPQCTKSETFSFSQIFEKFKSSNNRNHQEDIQKNHLYVHFIYLPREKAMKQSFQLLQNITQIVEKVCERQRLQKNQVSSIKDRFGRTIYTICRLKLTIFDHLEQPYDPDAMNLQDEQDQNQEIQSEDELEYNQNSKRKQSLFESMVNYFKSPYKPIPFSELKDYLNTTLISSLYSEFQQEIWHNQHIICPIVVSFNSLLPKYLQILMKVFQINPQSMQVKFNYHKFNQKYQKASPIDSRVVLIEDFYKLYSKDMEQLKCRDVKRLWNYIFKKIVIYFIDLFEGNTLKGYRLQRVLSLFLGPNYQSVKFEFNLLRVQFTLPILEKFFQFYNKQKEQHFKQVPIFLCFVDSTHCYVLRSSTYYHDPYDTDLKLINLERTKNAPQLSVHALIEAGRKQFLFEHMKRFKQSLKDQPFNHYSWGFDSSKIDKQDPNTRRIFIQQKVNSQ